MSNIDQRKLTPEITRLEGRIVATRDAAAQAGDLAESLTREAERLEDSLLNLIRRHVRPGYRRGWAAIDLGWILL